ncbi:MAG: cyclic nucleotide-binding domain-containing protein [Myxococcota bacterium]
MSDADQPPGGDLEFSLSADDISSLACVADSYLFRTIDDVGRRRLLAGGVLRAYHAGMVIVREGDYGDDFFMVKDGRVKVYTGQRGSLVGLATLGPGACFGEVAVLSGQPRTATVEAAEPVELVRFTKRNIDDVLRHYPRVREILRTLVVGRAEATIDKITPRLAPRARLAGATPAPPAAPPVAPPAAPPEGDEAAAAALIASSYLFRSIDDKGRARLIAGGALETHPAGAAIVREGDQSDDFFMVRSGHVRVTTANSGAVVELATLGPGACFGEVAVLSHQARTATVETLEPVELVRFTRRLIDEILARYPKVRGLLGTIVAGRAAATIEKLTK